MLTWANALFYFVFLGQIVVISYSIPRILLARMRQVLETYAPAEYPKLYPKPIERYRRGHLTYRLANHVILTLGVVLLLVLVFVVDHAGSAADGFISEAWPAAYGMVQFLPLIFLEGSELSQFWEMRRVNTSTKRKAELRPRRFFDLVSPAALAAAVLLYVGAIAFDVVAHDFEVRWLILGTLTFANVFLGAVAARNVYGRRLDPYQSFADRARRVRANAMSLLYVSMAASAFYMVAAAQELFGLDHLDAAVMSLYFQVIVILSVGRVLRSLPLEQIDFDVYKGGAAAI